MTDDTQKTVNDEAGTGGALLNFVYVLLSLIGVIMLGSFLMSYDALYRVYLNNSTNPNMYLAWIWPLLIDIPVILFTIALFLTDLLGAGKAYLWWSGIILYTVLTLAFNLLYATPTFWGYVVAAVKPLGLFVSTEAIRIVTQQILIRVNGQRIFGLYIPFRGEKENGRDTGVWNLFIGLWGLVNKLWKFLNPPPPPSEQVVVSKPAKPKPEQLPPTESDIALLPSPPKIRTGGNRKPPAPLKKPAKGKSGQEGKPTGNKGQETLDYIAAHPGTPIGKVIAAVGVGKTRVYSLIAEGKITNKNGTLYPPQEE